VLCVLYKGVNGAAVQRNLDNSYWNTIQFAMASQYRTNASAVVILLGTDDSKQPTWNATQFVADYSSMVRHFKEFESRYRKNIDKS
jgi:hypothetical protein